MLKLLKKTKEFISVPYNLGYTTKLRYINNDIDITNSENLLSIFPLIYGVYFDEFELIFSKEHMITIEYYKDEILLSKISLEYSSQLENLYLFKPTKSEINTLHSLKIFYYNVKLFVQKWGKTELNFINSNIISSLYSFPRKIFLCSTSFNDEEHVFFPIDLVIDNPKSEIIYYSIRKSNKTVEKIIKEKKVTLIYSIYNQRVNILKLGRYHSHEFPKISELEFKTKKSCNFGHLIPEFLNNYIEIENILEKDIGSQILFIGRKTYKHCVSNNDIELAYCHSFTNLIEI